MRFLFPISPAQRQINFNLVGSWDSPNLNFSNHPSVDLTFDLLNWSSNFRSVDLTFCTNGSVAVGRCSGGRLPTPLVDRYFHNSFFFLQFLNPIFHSPSQPFLIEWLLEKNLLISQQNQVVNSSGSAHKGACTYYTINFGPILDSPPPLRHQHHHSSGPPTPP